MAAKTATAPAKPKKTAQAAPLGGGAPAPSNGQASREETIRQLAYQKWEAAGKPDGDGMCYWLEAERELIS